MLKEDGEEWSEGIINLCSMSDNADLARLQRPPVNPQEDLLLVMGDGRDLGMLATMDIDMGLGVGKRGGGDERRHSATPWVQFPAIYDRGY